MPDHILKLGLNGLHTYLNSLKPAQTTRFVLVTEFNCIPTQWHQLIKFLQSRQEVSILEADQEAGLITITCEAATIRQLLNKPELAESLVAINTDLPN